MNKYVIAIISVIVVTLLGLMYGLYSLDEEKCIAGGGKLEGNYFQYSCIIPPLTIVAPEDVSGPAIPVKSYPVEIPPSEK